MPSSSKKPLVTSNGTSRNAHDYTFTTDDNGRLVLSANKRGVRYRMGLIATLLAKGYTHRRDILSYLQKKTKNASYQDSDLAQVLKQFKKHGIVSTRGMGSDAVWLMTAKGKNLWDTLPKN